MTMNRQMRRHPAAFNILTKDALPDAPEHLEEALLDAAFLQKHVVDEAGHIDPDKMAVVVNHYREEMERNDPELTDQMREAMERGVVAFLSEAGIDLDAVQAAARRANVDLSQLPFGNAAAGAQAIYRQLNLSADQMQQIAATGRGPGAEISGQFENLGEFLTLAHHRSAHDDRRLRPANILGESSGDAGGFLVPEEYRAQLLRMALEGAVVRPRARIVPMAGLTVRYPAIRDASHASTVYGGVSASWVPEAGDVSSTTNEPTFSQVALTAKKLTGYTVAGNELLADSAIALEAILLQLFGEAIRYFEDDAFLTGVGGGQPLGVLNADALVSVAKEAGQSADTIVWENLVKMFSRMLPASMMSAIWYANPDTLPELATMSLAVGTGGAPVWLANGVGGVPNSILGRPLVFTEKAETVGDAGDIVFSDFDYYLIGDRQAMSVASSPHVRFTTDQTVWRLTERVDGRPWIDTALTPRNSSATLSPFVSLAARA